MDYSRIINRIGDHWENKFGKKIFKLNFHGNFTCPNLDGTISSNGCIYCSMKSLEPFIDLDENNQIEDHIKYLKERNGAEAFIAYFQDYSSTYPSGRIKDRLSYLKELYTKAVSHPDVVGISVSTRPDTITSKELDLLKSLNTDVTIELGLQSINEKDLKWIGRGHTVEQFTDAVELIFSYGFDIVAHIILGLPNETDHGIFELAEFINTNKISGLKIHQLMVLKGTRLEELYTQNKAPDILTDSEYFRRLGLLISNLKKDIVIHRLYADAPKKDLIAPLWCSNKTGLQDKIFKYFIDNGIRQGNSLKHL
ncbi:MAG: TIGR01212 family radical SAM protein [Candidatus Delongbacteria bacterium]|nr:TIGR01212 family radical SAM protein [Candidatus Delongbacteria bacterium]MCG2760183.1 TIGR01212 family radical SAM protein [Candidatus Delongbacteria bacterium]